MVASIMLGQSNFPIDSYTIPARDPEKRPLQLSAAPVPRSVDAVSH